MKTLARRRFPARVDVIYQEAAAALRTAAGCPKRCASYAGVSDELARRWFNGDPSNPLGRAAELQESVPDPEAVAFFFQTRARQRLMPMSDEELIARFFSLLRESTAAEADQIRRKVALAEEHDLTGLQEASAREGDLDQRLAATIGELRERRLDPWTRKREYPA
jgi:hypothetical protein